MKLGIAQLGPSRNICILNFNFQSGNICVLNFNLLKDVMNVALIICFHRNPDLVSVLIPGVSGASARPKCLVMAHLNQATVDHQLDGWKQLQSERQLPQLQEVGVSSLDRSSMLHRPTQDALQWIASLPSLRCQWVYKENHMFGSTF